MMMDAMPLKIEWLSKSDIIEATTTFFRSHIILSCAFAFGFYSAVSWFADRWKKKADVPYIYLSDSKWLSSLIEPFRLLTRAQEAARKGYEKFPRSFFRIPLLNYPSGVIVVDRYHLKELFSAPSSSLGFFEAALEDMDFRYTLPGNLFNLYHVKIIRTQLTQNIGALMPEMAEELTSAFEEFDTNMSKDWTPVVVYEMALKIVARISYRAFVGSDICRNQEFLEASIAHATKVAQYSQILCFLPKFLRPFVAPLFLDLHKADKVVRKYLTPIIDERQMMQETEGDDYQKPVDLLQWLMDSAQGTEKESHELVSRILMVNFAAIHTSSMALTHVLFDLASRPEYIAPLREEIETNLATNGWQKTTLMKMRKLDSFVKESLRLNMSGSVTSFRKVMKPYTFSNGLTVPVGEILAAPAGGIHADNSIYENATEFDGFRFSKMREKEEESAKHHSVYTGPEYLVFGHGEHSCPGRFFAVAEVKSILAFMLLRYDIKTLKGVRPSNWNIGVRTVPDMFAKILFKRRN